jgi:hypothetical protein
MIIGHPIDCASALYLLVQAGFSSSRWMNAGMLTEASAIGRRIGAPFGVVAARSLSKYVSATAETLCRAAFLFFSCRMAQSQDLQGLEWGLCSSFQEVTWSNRQSTLSSALYMTRLESE